MIKFARILMGITVAIRFFVSDLSAQPHRPETIVLMKPVSGSKVAPVPQISLLPVKTTDIRTIKAQYADLIKLKPDNEMKMFTQEEEKANYEAQAVNRNTRNRAILKASEKISTSFDLSELTFAQLQAASSDGLANANQQNNNQTVIAANTTSTTPKSQSSAIKDNIINSTDPLAVFSSLNATSPSISNLLAVNSSAGNSDEVTAASIRRSSGFMKSRSKVERNWITMLKLHESEAEQ